MENLKRKEETSPDALDIEHTLSWAYQQELPKRGKAVLAELGMNVKPAGFGSVSPMFQMASLGVAIDFSREPGFAPSEGPPHPDALLIADAVTACRDELEHYPWPTLRLNAGMERLVDDEEVERIWRQASRTLSTLLVLRAKLGDRPSLDPSSLPRPSPVLGSNGKPRYVRDVTRMTYKWNEEKGVDKPSIPQTYQEPVRPHRAGSGYAYKPGAYAELKWEPKPSDAVLERAEYAAWRIGLDLIYHAIHDQLEEIRIAPTAAPRLPWTNNETAERPKLKVIEDLATARKRRDEQEWAVAHRLYAAESRRRSAARREVGQALDSLTEAA